MRRIDFNPERDFKSWTPEQQEWWTAWSERAKAAADVVLEDHKAGRPPQFRGQIWGDLKAWLLQNVFEGKCAYCEIKIVGGFFGEGEHYRPKGKVTVRRERKRIPAEIAPGQEHGGYFWLAYDWSNLLPACDQCNNRKVDQFPVGQSHIFEPGVPAGVLDQRENPLLLHPYHDDPSRHLRFGKFGAIAARDGDARGLQTIEILGLDREGLTERRRVAQEAAYPALGIAILQYILENKEITASLDRYTSASAEFSMAIVDYLKDQLEEKKPGIRL